MKSQAHGWLPWIVLAALIYFPFSANADPIPVPPPFFNRGLPLMGIPIFLESLFVTLLLVKYRTPRGFFFWVFGMHFVTYPLFYFLLSELEMAQFFLPLDTFGGTIMRYLSPLIIAEALIIFLEGYLIYFMCRYLKPKTAVLPMLSIGKCLLVSLGGNLISFTVSVFFQVLYIRFGGSIDSPLF